MNLPDDLSSAPAPHYHGDSGAVRFWVLDAQGRHVGAIIRKELLHYRFEGDIDGGDALAVYQAHQQAIDDAVRRRLASGSLEPVLLRLSDLGHAPG